jgi:hypothetical protein
MIIVQDVTIKIIVKRRRLAMHTARSSVDVPATRAGALLLLAVVLAASWLALNFAFPALYPSGIPTVVTRLIIHGVIVVGLWLGLARTALDGRARIATGLAIAIPYTLWLALIWVLAVNGTFRPVPGAPPMVLIAIFAPVLIWLVVLIRSDRFATVADAMPSAWLVGVQVYRVFGGIFLVEWASNSLPGAFALPAGTGDVIVGLLALPAAVMVAQGTRGGRAVGIAWNLLGLLDLTVAITMGTLSTPGPLQVFGADLKDVQFGTYPIVMIPAFAVPTSIVLHGLSLWQLRRAARRAASIPLGSTRAAVPA